MSMLQHVSDRFSEIFYITLLKIFIGKVMRLSDSFFYSTLFVDSLLHQQQLARLKLKKRPTKETLDTKVVTLTQMIDPIKHGRKKTLDIDDDECIIE